MSMLAEFWCMQVSTPDPSCTVLYRVVLYILSVMFLNCIMRVVKQTTINYIKETVHFHLVKANGV